MHGVLREYGKQLTILNTAVYMAYWPAGIIEIVNVTRIVLKVEDPWATVSEFKEDFCY